MNEDEKQKEFTKSELIGRAKFKNNYCGRCYYHFTPYRYDAVDVEITGRTTPITAVVEIKNRLCNTNDYEKEGYILEVGKLDKIRKWQYGKGYEKAYYINFFQDKMAIVWDLDTIKWEEKETKLKKCPETTAGGKEVYVLKDCYMLFKEEAKEIRNYN